MVNEKSRLFAEHPDWVLKLGSYPVLTGRNQLVLDIARQDVADYLHERLAALVGDHDIAYLKWDMNRDYHLPGDRLGHPAAYRQVEALYSLLDRLHRQFPKLEIESCSSGGARADYGILRHTQRIWPSDSNDPVERMRIQTGFSYFFPPEIMGSHVGAEWSHTSGRGMRIGMSLLAACYGHMGIEADLTSMTETELDRIRNAVASHKADRHIWHCGRFFRIRTVDPNLIGAMGVDPERNSARLVLAQLDRPRSTTPPRIVVPGLDPDRIYRVRLGFATEMVARSVRRFDNPLAAEGYNASGAVLGTVGIGVPVMLAQSGLTIAIEETSEDDQ